MTAAQLDIIADTALRDEYSSSSSVIVAATSTVVRQAWEPNGKYSSSSSVKADPRIQRINKRRKDRNLSHDYICRYANASPRNWFRLLRGEQMPSDEMVKRLEAAIDKAPPPAPPQILVSYHRLVMGLCADVMQMPRETLFATDFSKQRPSNPQWLRAARIRQMASYITSVELEVSNADLGRAIGDTRANIKYARDAIEDLREEGSEIDRVLSAVTLQVRAG